jgi:hypothetical protein
MGEDPWSRRFAMLWVTRKRIRVNRTATTWLVRRFIDQKAEFVFVEPDEVANVQRAGLRAI